MKSSRNPKGIPDDFSPYYEAARTLLAEGADLPRAERYLRKYLTQDPEGETPSPALAHWRVGAGALRMEGRKPEAIAEVETALRLKPDLREAKKDLKCLEAD